MVSKKNLRLLIIALCAVILVLFSVWAARLERYCFVQDESWNVLGVTDELRDVRCKLLKDGIWLKIVTIEYDDKTDADFLKQKLLPLKRMKRVLINPVIVETSGEQTGSEGCLSYPGKCGDVTRPNYVKVEYYDENMEKQVIEGTELLARALCHEIEHLDGHMYVEKVEGEIRNVGEDMEEIEEE